MALLITINPTLDDVVSSCEAARNDVGVKASIVILLTRQNCVNLKLVRL